MVRNHRASLGAKSSVAAIGGRQSTDRSRNGQLEARAMATKRRATFDTKSFLARVGEGRSIGKYRKSQGVLSEGGAGDAGL
jgi:hypothetical protein